MAEFKIDPLNAAVSQGGFSKERGGNLRDHDGARPNEAAIAATTHYDGDADKGGNKGEFGGNQTLKKAADVAGAAIAKGVDAADAAMGHLPSKFATYVTGYDPSKEPKGGTRRHSRKRK